MPRVLIAAGGSGGHLFPAQQLAEMLKRKGDCELFFAGYRLAQSPFFIRQEIPFAEVAASPLGRLSFPYYFLKGLVQSLKILWKFKPKVVVGFGSYHVFPMLCAAVLMRKKIVLFEANCSLGKVNRFFRPFAKSMAFQFPGSDKGTAVPLLPWISHTQTWETKEARREYRLDPDALTFLVFGGSQGARFLNEQVPEALARFPGSKQVIHCTGMEDPSVEAAYQKLGIQAVVKVFESNMAKAYAAADCVICRSGAGTIAELIRHHKPALLIPFPAASEDHQRKNGEYLSRTSSARLLLQRDASIDRLAREIEGLVGELEAKKLSLQKIDLQYLNRTDFADLVRSVGGFS